MTIHVALLDKALWREFDAQCNEMIITKIGRNLFPILEVSFKGLNEHLHYRIGVTMEPTVIQKLKFTGGRWEKLDVMEDMVQSNEVFYVKSGRELLQRGLKLEKLKLTNSKDALQKSDQMIRVQSMRQYVPVLNIYEATPTGATVHVGRFPFVEAKFIAVTAYQSEQVKCLKVQKNKFAQGFRESVKAPPTSTKRPHSTVSANSSPDSTLSDGSEISVKKGRSEVYQAPPTPTANQYYQFQTVQNFQPSFQQNFGHHHGFDTAAGYWNPPPLQYDFTMGHSNMYGYQWNA